MAQGFVQDAVTEHIIRAVFRDALFWNVQRNILLIFAVSVTNFPALKQEAYLRMKCTRNGLMEIKKFMIME